MAAKTDHLAEKARKQKMILVVGGVLLLAVAGFQGSKMLGGSSAAPAPAGDEQAAATDSAAGSPVASPGTAQSASPVVALPELDNRPRPTAVLAGISVGGTLPPAAGDGQLHTFTLFTAKDPFEPQVVEKADAPATGTTATKPEPAPAQPEVPATPEPTPAPVPPAPAPVPPAPAPAPTPPPPPPAPKPVEPPPAYATIVLNGEVQPLQPEMVFPEDEPTFVLVSLNKKTAQIGIANGKLTEGETIPLVLNKPLTLVNTATGARYVLELVYLGAQPEQVTTFTQGAADPAATPVTPEP